jgi:hypothetical protein
MKDYASNPKYFLGLPCIHHHAGWRYKKHRNCVVCTLTRAKAHSITRHTRRTLDQASRPMPTNCECCGDARGAAKLHYDHDHRSGIFRGWLCGNCNRGIGQLGDTIGGLEAALIYLRASDATHLFKGSHPTEAEHPQEHG